jgi:two-component SAPR family response regulator
MGLFERAIFNLELGCCWLESEKIELATNMLRESVNLFGEGGNQMEQADARLWLEAALSIKDSAAAKRLKEAIPPQREWSKPTPQLVHAGKVVRWLKKHESRLFKDSVLKAFFEQAEHIQESLLEIYRKLESKSEHLQRPSYKLEITTFGDVEVRFNQRVLESSDWQTREARDLFLFLLQSNPLTKEQIALVFWPDISPARLKMRFKINIYRIRKAIGQDAVLFENERYRFNRTINYSWDRERLDETLSKLRLVTETSARIDLLSQVISLFKGSYLSDLDAEWLIPERLKYQDLQRDVMLELANIYLQQGRVQDCLATARLILRFDPLLEAAHRLIIQAYAVLHDPAGMTLQFRQYQQALDRELGLEPSSEISSLYEQLLTTI